MKSIIILGITTLMFCGSCVPDSEIEDQEINLIIAAEAAKNINEHDPDLDIEIVKENKNNDEDEESIWNKKPVPKPLPPQPLLMDDPPVKPDFKLIFHEKLKTPNKYTANWIPPKLGKKVHIYSPTGLGFSGYLVEVGYDYIKIKKSQESKVIYTYRKKSMKLKYRLIYLQEDFIKNEIRDEVLILVAEYNVEFKAYRQPMLDWERDVRKIQTENETALGDYEYIKRHTKLIKEGRENKKREQTQRVSACGERPTMGSIGFLEILPIVVQFHLKQTMHDYSSFSKVNGELFTSEFNGTKCWVWVMTYRGNNAFGNKIVNTHKFYIKNDRLLAMK